MKTVEILAPVGNRENLEAAVVAGADAIYLAGKSFGARSFAKNFSNDELVEAIRFCHIRDVYVYVTVNTLIKDSELKNVLKYIDFLYISDVDAVILQDIGLAAKIKDLYPDLEIHASTQMTAHSLNDVLFLEKMGFDRVILSRECSINEIKNIQINTSVELEVFIHGALCVSYSGQCLMSSMIGGRSGNRGRCAQPCRKKYTLMNEDEHIEDEGYLLSLKDLGTIDDYKALIDLGIASLKIEGRMKSPSYVYTVVKSYREELESHALKKVFNRGLTKGFPFDASFGSMASKDSPGNKGFYIGQIKAVENNYLVVDLAEDIQLQDEIQIRREQKSIGTRIEKIISKGITVTKAKANSEVKILFNKKAYLGEKIYKTYDVVYKDRIKQAIHDENVHIPIEMKVILTIGKTPVMIIKDNRGHQIDASIDFTIEKASKRPVTLEQVKEQLSKLGSTPYDIKDLEVIKDDDIFMPVSRINALRRAGVEALNEKRQRVYHKRESVVFDDIKYKSMDKKSMGKKLFVSVDNLSHLKAILNYSIDGIYYRDYRTFKAAKEICKDQKLVLTLNNISTDNSYDLIKKVIDLQDVVQVNNIGQLEYFKEHLYSGGYALNVYNTFTSNHLANYGLKRLVLSPELTLNEMNEISNKSQALTEGIIYGKIPVMTTKYNFVKNQKDLYLVDQYEDRFKLNPIQEDLLQVLDAKTLFLLDHYRDLLESSLDVLTVYLTDEEPGLVNHVLKSHIELMNENINKEFITHRDLCKKVLKTYTGHFYSPVE